eukprot:5899959-Prymnesium_polylepis.1
MYRETTRTQVPCSSRQTTRTHALCSSPVASDPTRCPHAPTCVCSPPPAAAADHLPLLGPHPFPRAAAVPDGPPQTRHRQGEQEQV